VEAPAGRRDDTGAVSSDHLSTAAALDFWLGDWSCTWDGGHGRNRVAKEFDGRVVVERFESLAPERWSGMSLSVFDERTRRWRQTWVDSTGNYWALDEGRDRDDVTFEVDEIETGDDGSSAEVRKRMVFSDIARDAFHWRWERSSDGGAGWEPLWTIDYRRGEGIGTAGAAT
jgi:hypothetical protein